MTTTYEAKPHTVQITHPDKVMFPDDEVTKQDLVNYYGAIAPLMLPHLKDRPITMNRFPDGISGSFFVQQAAADYYPAWIDRARVSKEKGEGEIEHPVINTQSSLVYLVNQNCIVFHTWLSRTAHPEQPDRLVFDLDPSDDDFGKVREGAFILKDLLDELELASYVMTTGSRGVHISVPVKSEEHFDTVRDFARRLAELVSEQHPGLMTTEQRKNKRGDRVYIDILRNSYGQSAVAPYSVRAKPGAPVATPISWDLLRDRATGPQSYTIHNVVDHTGRHGDLWEGMARHSRSIHGPGEKLDRMRKG